MERARKTYNTIWKLFKRVIAIAVSLNSRDLRKHGSHGNKKFIGNTIANDVLILKPYVLPKGFLQNEIT